MVDPSQKLCDDLTLMEVLQTSHREFLSEQFDPPPSVLANLERHVTDLWVPVRAILGVPIRVSSGYRCWGLNKAVGGSMTSAHAAGLATDNIPLGMSLAEAMERIIKALPELPIDQVIYEYGHWIHLGSPQDGQPPRRQAEMKFTGMVGYLPWDPSNKRVA